PHEAAQPPSLDGRAMADDCPVLHGSRCRVRPHARCAEGTPGNVPCNREVLDTTDRRVDGWTPMILVKNGLLRRADQWPWKNGMRTSSVKPLIVSRMPRTASADENQKIGREA